MPTYEYRCEKGHEFEVFQRMSEPPVATCIHCGAKAERLMSAGVGLLFKGSGFYITDYRSDSYKKAAEADKGGSKPAESEKASSKPAESKAVESKSTDAGKSGTSTPSSSSGSD